MMHDDEQLREYNEVFAKGEGYSRDWRRFARYFEHLDSLGVNPVTARVLDVGCGPGPLEAYLRDYGFQHVDAMDHAEEGLKIAKRDTPSYSYALCDVCDIMNEYEGREFDVVFCLQVLEHLAGYMGVVRDMFALLSPGGFLVVSVPWDHCKNNRWHVNHFLPVDFKRIADTVGANLVLTERFGEHDYQLLAIMRRQK